MVFLAKNRVCVLSMLLKDESPHGAAMHYSHADSPLQIYIQTENTSRKMSGLLKRSSVKASVVIGFSEDEFRTLQMDGNIKVLPSTKLKSVHKIHYTKHPEAKQWKDDPATVFLVFKPTWWIYIEYKPKFFALSSK